MISTKGRYALRVLIDIAEQNKDEYIPLKDIAERQKISKKYLESIVKTLVDGGLLTGISGKNGGYKLTKKPNKCSIAEILTLSEGSLSTVSCLNEKNAPCARKKSCKTLPMWVELDNMVKKFFTKKHLSDLL